MQNAAPSPIRRILAMVTSPLTLIGAFFANTAVGWRHTTADPRDRADWVFGALLAGIALLVARQLPMDVGLLLGLVLVLVAINALAYRGQFVRDCRKGAAKNDDPLCYDDAPDWDKPDSSGQSPDKHKYKSTSLDLTSGAETRSENPDAPRNGAAICDVNAFRQDTARPAEASREAS